MLGIGSKVLRLDDGVAGECWNCFLMRMSFSLLYGGYLLIHIFLLIGSYCYDRGHLDRSSTNSSFHCPTYARAIRAG